MPEPVHVFIASTTGLVCINAIAHRNGQSLASFVTIAGSSKVSGITPNYRHFVDKQISPLAPYFEHDSYHMVIAADIHQGESWQFASALAHLLYTNDALGNGEVKPGDRVIIASGVVDAANANIRLVSHLAQKCLQAQHQILQWQQQHCRIQFFVPEENYRQPLPDVPFTLTPISNMADAEHVLVEQGIIAQSPFTEPFQEKKRPSSIAKIRVGAGSNTLTNTQMPHKSQVFAKCDSAVRRIVKYVSEHNKVIKALLAMAIVLGLLWALVDWLIDTQKPEEIVLRYQQTVLGNCDAQSADALTLQKQDAAVTSFNALELSRLCSMTIAFANLQHMPSEVYLLSDSYALIPLRALGTDSKNIHEYAIPLPQWQEASREYFLVAFANPLDKSDIQSLQAYLASMHQQAEALSIDNLLQWLDKQGMSARIIRHRLEK